LLRVLSGGGQSPQGIIGNGDAQSSAADALPNDAMTILAKSPPLSSLLLSNSTFKNQFLAAAAPAHAQISVMSSAVLSCISHLQQKTSDCVDDD
jgi:hypothetical protein